MRPRAVGRDTASVTSRYWVHEVIIDIAIKNLFPRPREWESNTISPIRALRK